MEIRDLPDFEIFSLIIDKTLKDGEDVAGLWIGSMAAGSFRGSKNLAKKMIKGEKYGYENTSLV